MTVDDVTGAAGSARPVIGGAFRLLGSLHRLGAARVSQLQRDCGLPRTTVYRLLTQLEEVGAVERSAGRWRLGPTLVEFGAGVPAEPRLREAVVVSATPDQLYGRLLRGTAGVPAGVRAQAGRYRFRRGCFQMNLALSARPRFRDPRLDAGGGLNLGRGIDALVTSVRQAEGGLPPEHPSIAWHEPPAVDPTRAPEGRAVVRLQVLDVPHTPRGDAAGTRYGTGGWDPATAEAFADRVLAEAEPHVPGLTGLVLERHLTTPADLAKASPNAGPGDHAAGDAARAVTGTGAGWPSPAW
jgi:phytoene dehydrogenase-like protein